MKTDLESIANGLKTPPRMPEGIRYPSQLVSLSLDFILKIVGMNNYREHSSKEIKNLSKTIKKDGLLEPITICYDTETGKWDFIDGEGRFWASYNTGAKEMSTEIYYNLPEDIRLRMKIAANSTKTKIDAVDMALFTQRLYDLLTKYNIKNDIKTEGKSAPSIKELSELLSRSWHTTKNYMLFNDLHKDVIDYVKAHPEKNLFSRTVSIGRKLKNKNHQRSFLAYVKNLEKTTPSKVGKKLGDYEFKTRLRKYAAIKKESKEFALSLSQDKYIPGTDIIRDIRQSITVANRYIASFRNIMEYYPEIKNGELKRLVIEAKEEYLKLLSRLPESMQGFAKYIEHQKPSQNFRDKILSKLHKKDDSDDYVVHAIGDKIHYIRLNKIRFAKSQLRSKYNQDSIDSLAEEFKEYGQIKPGLLNVTKDKNGNPVYTVVYGHTRYLAAQKAGLKYYKTFIKKGLSKLEISLLQSIEDLSEQDTPAERAKVLNKQYNLMLKKASNDGRKYYKTDFYKDFKHLGTKKTLRDALEFMELNVNLRNMVSQRIIGYEAAIKVGSLPEEKQPEILYEVMCRDPDSKEIDSMIKRTRENENQHQLFDDEPKSYSKIFEKLSIESKLPFGKIIYAMNTAQGGIKEKILSNKSLLKEYVALYKSIISLENALN